jgi:dihydroorotase
MKILLKAATILDKTSPFHKQQKDLLIENNLFVAIADHIACPEDCKEIQLDNLHVSKGWFDSSVSFGEPGYEERETIEKGLEVAAKSGFTSIGIQPNTIPITDKSTEIEYLKSISSNSFVHSYPIGALTKNSKGVELAEILEMANSGAIGFGDYKKPMSNPNMLKLALLYSKKFNYPIFSFPFEKSINGDGVMNESVSSTLLGLKGIPSISEEMNIYRDLSILEYTGGHLHIPTISTAKSVDLIREAKLKKLNVSCSTTAHNLFFNDSKLQSFDTNFKVLPPLRSDKDIESLITGVKDGTIDMVISDHNPLNIELKNLEFDNADFGTIGLESCFGALNKLFSTKMTIDILTRGKKVFNIKNNSIRIGEIADITMFNPLHDYSFTEKNIFSISKNSIFSGSKLKGLVYGTICNSKITINE